MGERLLLAIMNRKVAKESQCVDKKKHTTEGEP